MPATPAKEAAMGASSISPAVVVGIDGSRPALCAAAWAVPEAVFRDLPLRLIYVIEPATGAVDPQTRFEMARSALAEAQSVVVAADQQVDVEFEILEGKTMTRLCEASSSAVMVCIGAGERPARSDGFTAPALIAAAICPVAVIRCWTSPVNPPAVDHVVAEADNGVVLRCAFEEARLRVAPLRILARTLPDDRDRRGRVQLDRRVARWARLYPDVVVETVEVAVGARRYCPDAQRPNQLMVTQNFGRSEIADAHRAGFSVIAVRPNLA